MKLKFLHLLSRKCLFKASFPFLFLLSSGLFAQVPTDNPYRTFYTDSVKPYNIMPPKHWTDNLKWTNTVDVTSELTTKLGMTQNITSDCSGGKPCYTLTQGAPGSPGFPNLSPVVNEAITRLSAAGGGVLYFPAESDNSPRFYHFGVETPATDTDPSDDVDNSGFDIILKEGVILRGQTPIKSQRNATYESPTVAGYILDVDGNSNPAHFGMGNFAPPSKFIFPKYNPILSGPTGRNNNTAFMKIYSYGNDSNIGLVWFDINRGSVKIQCPLTAYANLGQFIGTKNNILIMGNRINNSAEPQDLEHLWGPFVTAANVRPNADQVAAGGGWCRWVWRFSTTIMVEATGNTAIINNRIADMYNNTTYPVTDDSYDQPGYVLRRRTSNTDNVYGPAPATITVGSGASARTVKPTTTFDYCRHYGININRKKPTVTYAKPTEEPYLFYENNEIVDNWVYNTMRVGFMGSGTNLNISGNIKRDNHYKPLIYTSLVGDAREWNSSATYENRGIDFSGINCKVSYNTYEVTRDQFTSGYPSVDGEGILVQECCGGTIVQDYYVNNNTGNAYVGIYKMNDVVNVHIENNTLTSRTFQKDGNIISGGSGGATDAGEIWLFADVNGGLRRAEGVYINNNTMLGNIRVVAGAGVEYEPTQNISCEIKNNKRYPVSGAGSGTIDFPCACDTSGNVGWTARTVTNVPVGAKQCKSSAMTFSSFSPTAGLVGSRIYITGDNLAAVDTIYFNNVPSPVEKIYSNKLVSVNVPVGATTGTIRLKSAGSYQTAVNSSFFYPNTTTSTDVFTVVTDPAVIVETPVITVTNVANGFKEVTLSCNTIGAEIFWTADGREPNRGSNKYRTGEKILIIDTVLITAKAYATATTPASVTNRVSSATSTTVNVARVSNAPRYEFRPWYNDKAGAASVTVDGNDMPANIANILTTRGFRGTLFNPSSSASNARMITLTSQGHEIGSRGQTGVDLTTLSLTDASTQLTNSKIAIDNQVRLANTGATTVSLSFPMGAANDNIRLLAEEAGYEGARIQTVHPTGVYSYRNRNFYTVNSFVVDTATTIDRFKTSANAAIIANGWFVATYNTGFGSAANRSSGMIDSLVFREQMDSLKSLEKNLWVAPFGTVLRYHRQRSNAKLGFVSVDGSGMKFKVEDYQDTSVYKGLITVSVLLAEGAQVSKIRQNGVDFTTPINGANTYELDTIFEAGKALVFATMNVNPDPALDVEITYGGSQPSISPSVEAQTCSVTVTMNAPATVNIYYTTDGSTPSTKSSLYSGAFTLNRNTLVRAISIDKTDTTIKSAVINRNYVVATCAPVLSQPAGSYVFSVTANASLSSTASNGLPGLAIRFTTDGSEPTESSPLLSSAQTFTATTTLKVKGFSDVTSPSETVTAVYTITAPNLPVVSPANDVLTCSGSVTMATPDAGYSVYYTTNGSTPNAKSTKYTTAITLLENTTIRAISINDADTAKRSGVVTRNFTVALCEPVISPSSSSQSGLFNVTASLAGTASAGISGVTFRYTTDGSEPTESSPILTSLAVFESKTIKVKAYAANNAASATATKSYIVTLAAATPFTFMKAGNNNDTTVTVSNLASYDSVFYTTDGSVPTISSTRYTSGVLVTSGNPRLIRFLGFKAGSEQAMGNISVGALNTLSLRYSVGGGAATANNSLSANLPAENIVVSAVNANGGAAVSGLVVTWRNLDSAQTVNSSTITMRCKGKVAISAAAEGFDLLNDTITVANTTAVVYTFSIGGRTITGSGNLGNIVGSSLMTITASPSYATFSYTINDTGLRVYTAPFSTVSGTVRAFNSGSTCFSNVSSATATLSVVTGLTLEDISSSVVVFPNPASGSVTVSIDNAEAGEVNVKITNMLGVLVRATSYSKQEGLLEAKVDLSGLPSGIYTVELQQGNRRGVKRITVE